MGVFRWGRKSVHFLMGMFKYISCVCGCGIDRFRGLWKLYIGQKVSRQHSSLYYVSSPRSLSCGICVDLIYYITKAALRVYLCRRENRPLLCKSNVASETITLEFLESVTWFLDPLKNIICFTQQVNKGKVYVILTQPSGWRPSC